jgi:hypothetical protein
MDRCGLEMHDMHCVRLGKFLPAPPVFIPLNGINARPTLFPSLPHSDLLRDLTAAWLKGRESHLKLPRGDAVWVLNFFLAAAKLTGNRP